MLALALAGGGYGAIAVSATAAVTWALVLGLMLAGRGDLGTLAAPPFAVAAAALLLFGLLTALSLSWSPDPDQGFVEVVRVAGYAGVFVLAGLAMAPGWGATALRGVLIAVVATALVALGSRLLGIGEGDRELAADLPPASGRLSFPLGYWNALGALMALAIPILMATAAGARDRLRAGGWLAAAVPILLAIYMTSSRGALIAAFAAAGITTGLSPNRPRALAAAVLALIVALPAIAAAELSSGILDSAGDGSVGSSELTVLAVAAAAATAAVVLGGAALERVQALAAAVPLPPLRIAIPALALVAAALVALVGPAKIVDDFRSVPSTPRAGELLLSSGSGRSQFWGAALDAFADEPGRGIGAGGYATYWNQHSTLGTPARNAHSEPLEALAELGVLGLALLAAFAGAVGSAAVAKRRAPGGAAAAGVLAAGGVGYLIDWTWQVPAVTVPVLIVAAGLAGRGFAAIEDRSARASAFGPLAATAAGAALAALAAASLWAAAALGLGADQLERSDDALGRGDSGAAAEHARAAAAAQPWAAEPYLRLAEIEQGVGNVRAADAAAGAAIERAPDDFRSWILAAQLEAELGEPEVAAAYAQRAVALAPTLFGRITEFIPEARSPGA